MILDGKTTSQKIMSELKGKLDKNNQPLINLDIILVGDDPSSRLYVDLKQKKAKDVGVGGKIHELPSTSTTQDVVDLIQKLNNDSSVTGLMVQLPLPSPIDRDLVLEAINPKKDADGLTSYNLGLLFHKDPSAIASATSFGIIKLIEEYNINLDGKNAVIIGRSVDVGLPLFALFNNCNATVTICHSHTQNLAEICQKADVLVSIVGQKNFISADFIKDGAIVIDVGTSLDPETGKIVGDIDFDSVAPKCSYITPSPGGVGPMTIASLLLNTVEIYKRNK